MSEPATFELGLDRPVAVRPVAFVLAGEGLLLALALAVWAAVAHFGFDLEVFESGDNVLLVAIAAGLGDLYFNVRPRLPIGGGVVDAPPGLVRFEETGDLVRTGLGSFVLGTIVGFGLIVASKELGFEAALGGAIAFLLGAAVAHVAGAAYVRTWEARRDQRLFAGRPEDAEDEVLYGLRAETSRL